MNPETFQLTLEQQFNIKVMDNEIDSCNNVEELKEELRKAIRVAESRQSIIRDLCRQLMSG